MKESVFLAEVDFAEVVGVIIALLYGGIWLFRRIAESHQQKAPAAAVPKVAAAISDEEAMRRFFSSLGVDQKAQAEQILPPPRPKPARRPKARPQAAQAQVREGDYLAHEAAQPFTDIKQIAPEIKTVKRVQARDRLEFPKFTPLQRAIVMSEIIGRRRS